MEYSEHLLRTKIERITEFKDKYYELIDENNTMKLSVDPTKISPSVSRINVKCGIIIHNILELYTNQLVEDNKTHGYLINYDGGPLPYTVETSEYLELVKRLRRKSVAFFESFCDAHKAILAAKNVEEVFAVVYPPQSVIDM